MKESGERSKLLLLLLAQAVLSAVFVGWRLLDVDEGFYLSAARQVGAGQLPYLDFFHPQMPFLSFLGAPFADWGITSLLFLRALTAAAGLLLTYRVYRLVRRVTDEGGVALIAAALVGLSGIFLAWHTTFKPYGWTDLTLFLSFSFMIGGHLEGELRRGHTFLSFLFLGLAIGFRSVFVVLVPLYAYWLWQDLRQRDQRKSPQLTTALAGLALPLLPAFLLWLGSADAFWFNNLGYHLQRSGPSTISDILLNKVSSFGRFLLLPQSLILVGMIAATIALRRSSPERHWRVAKRALLVAALIAMVYLLPDPIHAQYFQQCVSFMVIAAVPAIWAMLQVPAMRHLRRLGAVLYVVGIAPFIYLFLAAPRADDQRMTWHNIHEVVDFIQANSEPGDTLLSEWAGYAVLAQRPQLAGGEHVGFQLLAALDQRQCARYEMLGDDRIVAALERHTPGLVVVDGTPIDAWQPALTDNYVVAATTNTTSVYEYANLTD